VRSERARAAVALCAGLFLSALARADVQDTQRAEVAHLLAYVELAACPVERNGKIYPASEAPDHIRKKYAHFRDKIGSTEEFIDLAASRSEVSKKPYRVLCQGKEAVEAKQFMLEELKRYRAKSK
jgi:Family of unknown function (DUF5329)